MPARISTDTIKYNIMFNILGSTMPTAQQHVKKVGGSMMVVIPADIVAAENIHPGEEVEVTFKKRRKSYFGCMKGLGPFTKEDRMRSKYE